MLCLKCYKDNRGEDGIIRHSVRTPLYPYKYDLVKIYVNNLPSHKKYKINSI